MTALNVASLIGHFHPLLVHLPIGLLLAGVLFQWLSETQRYGQIKPAVPVLLWLGTGSAILSCVTGYLLSLNGEYQSDTLNSHQWMAVGTTVTGLLLCYLNHKALLLPYQKYAGLLLMVMLIITGHWGGTLTHGKGYLFKGTSNTDSKNAIPPVAEVQEALVYQQLVKPLLDARCVSCHNNEKRKGKLILSSPEGILKGGENGPVIIAGRAGESPLMERLMLSTDNEKHMPPVEKPQLSSGEIRLLQWWIQTGAGFTKKCRDLPQDSEMKQILTAFSGNQPQKNMLLSDDELNEDDVPEINQQALINVQQKGIVAIPVRKSSKLLYVNLRNMSVPLNDAMASLETLKNNILWLHAGNTKLTDQHLSVIGKMSRLSKLHLQGTAISDNGFDALKNLHSLQYLNVSGTAVSVSGLEKLTGLKALKKIFVFETAVTRRDLNRIKVTAPGWDMDTGGYRVPTLMQDTVAVVQ